ncbi:hypothetical protein CMQ_7831 [Grosmannia clavigera kw1407]|uniref:Uncharacterized protein n=1 Tax=Grosmannia clavigera (strain kw1407 / UAMH 11150) TaxID=655863 RepID=F0XS84_GROCL|nr:uncharacterized protein CMQ_7831 [Grosmannia clavigera kw1407]EFW99463.1 hypothetical protein CMQ_7831 [Grosmannia clavigera kw1407]
MSSPNMPNAEILALASQVQNFLPETADRQPSFFLSLAPATSASYPRPKKAVVAPVGAAVAAAVSEKKELSDSTTVVAAAMTSVEEAVPEKTSVKQRRSSSLSSSDSIKSGPVFRFLKLGPVHWGEHLDDHQQDWNEVAIE